jgi:hypothetical protein
MNLFFHHSILESIFRSDMQCMWWEIELSRAHQRKGEIGPALRSLEDVFSQYEEIMEDEFDFSSYCMRRMTLRQYVDFLEAQNGLKKQKAFRRATKWFTSKKAFRHDTPCALL